MDLSLDDFYRICDKRGISEIVYHSGDQNVENSIFPKHESMKFDRLLIKPYMRRVYIINNSGVIEYDRVSKITQGNTYGNVSEFVIHCDTDAQVEFVETLLINFK